MARKKQPARVLGPYAEADKHRIVVIDEAGHRTARYYDSKRDAERAKKQAANGLQRSVALAELIPPHLEDAVATGRMIPRSVESIGPALFSLFQDLRVADVTPRAASAMVESWPSKWTVASQRTRLCQVFGFWAWLVRESFAGVNPFHGLRIKGRPNRGKLQLRIGEAQRFTQAALDLYGEGHAFALAPLLGLMMGMRAGEICERVVRDVEPDGSVLWIEQGKTKNARRHLKVPGRIRPLLAQLVATRAHDELLWRYRYRRQDLHHLVRRLCVRAGVPVVCPHSWRGLWATLAVESGEACEAVAAALGHGSFAMTAKHYAQPSPARCMPRTPKGRSRHCSAIDPKTQTTQISDGENERTLIARMIRQPSGSSATSWRWRRACTPTSSCGSAWRCRDRS